MILKTRAPKMMGMILRQVNLCLMTKSEQEFARYGISWVDFQVLRFIAEISSDPSLKQTKGVNKKQIGEFYQLKIPAVSTAIKKLEGHGYITQGSSNENSSSKGLYITDDGKYFCSQMFKILCKMEIDLLAGVSSRDQGIIRNGLMKMFDNLQKEDV